MEKYLLHNEILCLVETKIELNDDTYMMDSALERQSKKYFSSNIKNSKALHMDIQGKLQFHQIKILIPFLYLLWKNSDLAIPQSQSHWYIDHQNHHYLSSLIVYNI